jgi:beta-glucosidase
VAAGCDPECGTTYSSLLEAVKQKLITEDQIDAALRHTFATRFRLGMFDPPERVPYNKIPATENDTPTHRQLALQVARESMVLLKNDGTLPLDKTKLRRVAVVGPNSWPTDVLYGNYNNSSSHPVTILEGLKNALGNGVQVDFAEGCPRSLKPGEVANAQEMDDAVALAAKSDVVIYVGGLDPKVLEGEMRDRETLELPEVQTELIEKLQATGKPVIVVNCTGSATAFAWAGQHVNAILQAWYPGEEGGTAVADVLTGNYNPSGRLPVTFYASDKDLPAYADYAMANRTYRYFTGTPQFPFGHGLSYTTFTYGAPQLDAAQVPASGSVKITVPVTNSGSRDGDEVVQVYAHPPNADALHLVRRLCAFQRVSLKAGETKNVELTLPAEQLRSYDLAQKKYAVCPGAYELQIGASSSDIRQRQTLTIP